MLTEEDLKAIRAIVIETIAEATRWKQVKPRAVPLPYTTTKRETDTNRVLKKIKTTGSRGIKRHILLKKTKLRAGQLNTATNDLCKDGVIRQAVEFKNKGRHGLVYFYISSNEQN